MEQIQTAHQKALSINLDLSKYGTFAEIGAGQEVVRWFFRVGGAAGTVAKSMSAYDMTVSDAIYGKCERYVSRERVLQMLDHEYSLNLERLSMSRKQLFAFADTIAAKSYARVSQCHGWLGIRFQSHPGAPPSQILIHVQMWDNDNWLQQEAVGIAGVNLIYGAFELSSDPSNLVRSLLDSLTPQRLQIDSIELSGPAFQAVDNRLMAVLLVKFGLAEVAMFAADGSVLQPSEALYKRPVLVERGSFSPVTRTHVDILESSLRRFRLDCGSSTREPLSVMEITVSSLLDTGQLDSNDFLARADMLAAVGKSVMITDYGHHYRLASYVRRYTQEPCGLALGAGALRDLLDEKHYDRLDGGILEGLGQLFKGDFKVYVYPVLEGTSLTNSENFQPPPMLVDIYRYLLKRGSLVAVEDFDETCLSINTNDVRARIAVGDTSWQTMVPSAVGEMIRTRELFGYVAPAHREPIATTLESQGSAAL